MPKGKYKVAETTYTKGFVTYEINEYGKYVKKIDDVRHPMPEKVYEIYYENGNGEPEKDEDGVLVIFSDTYTNLEDAIKKCEELNCEIGTEKLKMFQKINRYFEKLNESSSKEDRKLVTFWDEIKIATKNKLEENKIPDGEKEATAYILKVLAKEDMEYNKITIIPILLKFAIEEFGISYREYCPTLYKAYKKKG